MHLCYLDESGTPEAGANTNHFVLLGLAIPAETWKDKDRQVSQIKARYGLQASEIHTAWMWRDYSEQNAVPGFERLSRTERARAVRGVRALTFARAATRARTNELRRRQRSTDAYIHLTLTERRGCLRDLADLVGAWSDAWIFADAQDKRVGGSTPFDFAFEQVVTRFNTCLKRMNAGHGLLVQDNNETVAKRLTDLMRRYHRQGTLWSDVDHLVETPLFVDSQLTSMVQLADLCGYATRRFFDNAETDLFDRIYGCFDRCGGRLVGLRHYTGPTPCTCRVCIDHGR